MLVPPPLTPGAAGLIEAASKAGRGVFCDGVRLGNAFRTPTTRETVITDSPVPAANSFLRRFSLATLRLVIGFLPPPQLDNALEAGVDMRFAARKLLKSGGTTG